MIKFVGIETGKVYAEGSRSECFRELQEKYPSTLGYKKGSYTGVRSIASVYPETLKVVRE